MKILITILLFIPLIADSGTINKEYNKLYNDLTIIQNTIDWVKSESIKQEMRNKKLKVLSDIEYCLSH